MHYEPESGELQADGIKTAVINASESINATAPTITCAALVKILLDTPEVECTNNLTTGTLNVKKGGTMSGNVFTNNGTLNVLSGSAGNLTTTRLNNNGSIIVDSGATFEFGNGGGMLPELNSVARHCGSRYSTPSPMRSRCTKPSIGCAEL